MTDEAVLLEEPGVRVTTTRVTLQSTTYPVNGLTSIRLAEEADSGLFFLFLFPALFLLVCSGMCGLAAIMPGFALQSQLMLLTMALILGLFGVGMLGVAVFFARRPPTYVLWIGTAGGDRRGLATRDRTRADRIRAAIEEAITRRG